MEQLIGKVYKTKNYGDVRVISYQNSRDILVQFLDTGATTSATMGNLKKGLLRDYYKKTNYGVGFLGVGKYSSTSDKKIYTAWRNMFRRCYSGKDAGYDDVSVCEEWHNFQVFACWAYSQKMSIDPDWELDKDILSATGKIYSPDFCRFVPRNINMAFVKTKNFNKRGNLPIGVSKSSSQKGKYRASVSVGDKVINSNFDTIQEAFAWYKNNKEAYLKTLANNYIDNLDKNIYTKLIEYSVSLED